MRKIVVFNKMNDPLTREMEELSRFSDVELIKSPAVEEADLIRDAKDAEIILFTSAKLNRNVISSLEKCKMIQRYGIGYDTVDTEAAREAGIFVCNSPNYGVTDVAEHAFALIMSCIKNLTRMNDRVREGNMGFVDMGCWMRLTGKTVGFVGFGKIARALCGMMKAFGISPIVYDPYVTYAALSEYGAKSVSLNEVMSSADIVTVHAPLTEGTRQLIGKEELALVKPSVIIVNTSRGPLIDEAALAEALSEGRVFAAGLDVYENETEATDERIRNARNVSLTPHVAWNTAEAVVALHEEVALNVARYLEGKRPDSVVNGL